MYGKWSELKGEVDNELELDYLLQDFVLEIVNQFPESWQKQKAK
jgi:hypothetical protein